MVYDVLIKNGRVIDGTGNPWFKADIVVHDGRIVNVGRQSSEEARRIIDASELVVCPGFIDIHAHSDLHLLVNTKAESHIKQGITTEVVGNCGMSVVPVSKYVKERYEKIAEAYGIKYDWENLRDYMIKLERHRIAINVAFLIGHNAIRAAIMGYKNENRPPTKDEINRMKGLVSQYMEDGAYGLSTGLFYPPGGFAKTDEIIQLCKVVAEYGGFYASHIRGEGDPLIESVAEAIQIGEKASLPVEISHHKACGRSNWGKVKETLRMMEEASSRGVNVTYDVYPWTCSSTGLVYSLPIWVHEGGPQKVVKRLRNPDIRKRLRKEMLEGSPSWSSMVKQIGFEGIRVAYSSKHRELEGRSIKEIVESMGEDPFDFIFDLLIEEKGEVAVVCEEMCDEDVNTVIKNHLSMIGTDSPALVPCGFLGEGKPHPRAYGSYPRLFELYVRKNRVLTLEEAVRKSSSLPAQRLGLKDRGLIKEVMWADITIFNPKEIMNKATYQDPHQFPEAIEYVIVNGKVVIDRGKHTGVLPGKVLRHAAELVSEVHSTIY